MIPIDLTSLIREELLKNKREPDGKLHASSDLVGSLRHTQLRYVGAPEKTSDVTSDIRLQTGWFWHTYLHNMMRDKGIPFMAEVNLEPWMPDGWSGTADWLFWHPEYEAFVLGDLKTTKGEAIKFRNKEGMSKDHFFQLSAYFHACVRMGLPIVKGFAVMYLPMNARLGEKIEPTIIEATPAPEADVLARMSEVKDAVTRYADAAGNPEWVNDELAPPIERVQKLIWAKDKWDLKLVPHWLTDFCPYEDDLCDCNTQGTTKIGEYWVDDAKDLQYTPRRGYEDIQPTEEPDKWEIKRRTK